jgi:outer membrane protein assembly factor BamB
MRATSRSEGRARRRVAAGVAVLCALAAVGCSSDDGDDGEAAGSGGGSSSTTAAAGVEESDGERPDDGCGTGLPPEVAAEADGWPLPGRDPGNTRAVPDSPIDSSTIGDLEEVWTYDVPGSAMFGNLTTNPIVLDGRVHVGALDGSIHVVDLEDGAEVWSESRDISIFGPAGVAVGWSQVYGISDTATVVAHDRDTGEVAWETDLAAAPGNQVDMAPNLVGGCVLVSTQALAPGSRGTLYALDQADGEVVWQVETVPDDFWGNPEVNHGGGAWYPPAVDPDSGASYWGTSNPWPSPGAPGFPAGASRPGDNEHTNSLLAVEPDGGVRWTHQVFPHDIWDRDMVISILTEDGEGTPTVVHTGKGGVVLAYDAETGEVRWQTEVGMHQNDDLTDFEETTTVLPGVLGGVETPPAVADGVGYFAVMNAGSTYEPEDTFNLAPALGSNPSDLVALDLTTGEELWSVELPGDGLGGVTVVSDLLLTSTYGGLLLAFDRETGDEVWRLDVGRQVNGWPAVVGDTIVWPISGGDVSQLVALRLPG